MKSIVIGADHPPQSGEDDEDDAYSAPMAVKVAGTTTSKIYVVGLWFRYMPISQLWTSTTSNLEA